MNPNEEDLMHYGVKRRSGRYPWGSGDNPYQRTGDFLSRVAELEGNSERDPAMYYAYRLLKEYLYDSRHL